MLHIGRGVGASLACSQIHAEVPQCQTKDVLRAHSFFHLGVSAILALLRGVQAAIPGPGGRQECGGDEARHGQEAPRANEPNPALIPAHSHLQLSAGSWLSQ